MEFELAPTYTVEDFTAYWNGFLEKPPGQNSVKRASQKSTKAVGALLLICGLAMAALSIWADGFSKPLSIGTGVCFAAVGLLGLIRGTPRRPYWAQRAWEDYTKQGLRYTYRFSDEGVEIHSGVSDHRYDFAVVQQLWEDFEHFYLFLDAKNCHILNKNSFQKGDPAQFRVFIQQKTGKPVEFVR